jgi:predicted phage baseplate assembly protein
VSVIFGDGQAGARLPTGQENISAVYRAGIGPEGEVDRGQLALLKVRPLGIREVINPIRASGSAAPESMKDAQAHAPASVLTLQRVVSLQDYEDFAATFAGIGKAQASDLSSGERPLVYLTVAAAQGKHVDPSSELYKSLVSALEKHKDPVRQFLVGPHEEIPFHVGAVLRIDPRYISEAVLAQVRAALFEAFSFERRHFGQPVSAAEVVQVMQGVEGVVMVDLDMLRPLGGAGPVLSSLLRALPARRVAGEPKPAQLLLLDPDRSTVLIDDAAKLQQGLEERKRTLAAARTEKGVQS